MSDILRDPDYPNRPQHPDFWRLSEIILQLDGAIQAQGWNAVQQAVAGAIDPESLAYLASMRCAMCELVAARGQAPIPRQVLPGVATAGPLLRALYLEAFLVGYRFHERKGSAS